MITPKGNPPVYSPVYTAEEMEQRNTVWWFKQVVPRWAGQTMNTMIKDLRAGPHTIVPVVFIKVVLAEME